MLETLSVLQTTNTDPYKNLALEEYLLSQVKPKECILYLWQNKNTVVIGKNQNCWKECKVKEIQESGGHMVRRLSGGGAVFHDLGNLNFTFLVKKEYYDLNRQLAVILRALDMFGIPAKISGRNDITVFDKKVSGNAFYHSGDAYYHHGTLLIDVDLENLSRYLMVSADKMQSHGVNSVRSRVTNLKEHNSSITIDSLCDALIKAFGEIYEGHPQSLNSQTFDKQAIKDLEDKFRSFEWRFGRPIPFKTELIKRFAWGEIQLFLDINSGVIQDAAGFSDAMDIDFIPYIAKSLIGLKYNGEAMCDKIRSLNLNVITDEIKEDLCSLITNTLTE